MTRPQWCYKRAKLRLSKKSSFGFQFGDAWKWSAVEAITQILVNDAKPFTRQWR